MIANAFNMFNSFNIGSKNPPDLRLVVDPTIAVGSPDHWFILYFGIPTLIISGLSLPLLFLLKLRKAKNSIEDQQFVSTYNFFYRAYKDEYYLWEFIILIRKLALVGASVFLTRDLIYMCVTLSIIIVVSGGLQLHYSPFKTKELNKLELIGLFCLVAINYGSIYHMNLGTELSTIFYISLAMISTIIFIIMWIRTIKGYLHDKITSVCHSLKNHSIKCCTWLKRPLICCLSSVFRIQARNDRSDHIRSKEINQELDMVRNFN